MYSDSTAVLGPLAGSAEPHNYDLCERHASRTTAPLGWTVVRVAPSTEDYAGKFDASIDEETIERDKLMQRQIELSKPVSPPKDDWALLAEAVQEDNSTSADELIQSVRSPLGPVPPAPGFHVPKHSMHDAEVDPTEIMRRGHLRVLRGEG